VPSPGGQPINLCNSTCGVPPNNTPIFVVGNYRGLEVDVKYVKGEWQAKITTNDITIIDPTGKTAFKGYVRQYNNELWLVTPEGTYRGIFGLQQVPELTILTWALSPPGQPAPPTFDAGLTNGQTFVFAKCINPATCQWHLFQSLAQVKARQENWLEKRAGLSSLSTLQIHDPCSKYPDCHTCIKAPESCGWCSVNVVYNDSSVGKNCAGLNTTITPRFNCSGTFSTQDCVSTTTGTQTTSTGQTTGQPSMKYACNPYNQTCYETNNGTLPNDVCKAQCTVNPIPPILQNKYFRGLEVDTAYQQGEWRAHFTTNSVTVVSPTGTVIQGNVSTTAQYITIAMANGNKYQTIWQYQPGPSVNNLNWAWGVMNGKPPVSFDEAMVTPGEKEFWFVTCHDGAPTNVCDFSH
jgi:hypothetical protein